MARLAENNPRGETSGTAIGGGDRFPATRRTRGSVKGIVQGVGFRPFIYQLAQRFQLGGYVINNSSGVEIEVEGAPDAIDRFFEAVVSESPPLAHIFSLDRREVPPRNQEGFRIQASEPGEERTTLISPDVCICRDCLRELKDPGDRRFGYPFINCTNCGPRYTIITDIPYDRPATTMSRFVMCPECRREYDDPHDRRFHAQPNACWQCGPRISLHDAAGGPLPGDPVAETIHRLKEGNVLAIKGLGGFHLAVDAGNHRAVVRLRRRKHREEKPLALMVKDLDTARRIARMSETEARLLESHQRPIVLLNKRRFHGLSPQVAPRNRYFGVMLPYTPLHYLLMEGSFTALVMTSGNMTEEPITIDNSNALEQLAGIADYFLLHDRDIYLRSDDSVIKVVDQTPRQVRRSRGYVPVPVFLSDSLSHLPSVMAVGGELKNTVCLTKENRAFLSQHIGDLENLETLDFFTLTLSHLRRILEIRPRVLAHDLHPDYLSSRYARDQVELPAVAVQHHHAHIVSCLAEHRVSGPVIGLAMDGTGYGTDGQIWGGEILLADLASFKRAGHLEYVPLPGGDAAIKHPWRTALAYLDMTYGDGLHDLSIDFVKRLDEEQATVILQMVRGGINSPLTSSCGRLFDAVAALAGVRDWIAYEGQAAIELEMCRHTRETGSYRWQVRRENGKWIMETAPVIEGVVGDLACGLRRGVISSRFHNTLVRMLTDTCCRIREETGIQEVAMSGGTFQNAALLTGLVHSLSHAGFSTYTHSEVPSNDGCLSLGQAVCAGLRHAGQGGSFES